MKRTIGSITILTLVAVMTMMMTACGYDGTYYEIMEVAEEPYTLDIKGNTISYNEIGEVCSFDDDNGVLTTSYYGIPVSILRCDKYDGYDCLFEDNREFPSYCKSKKGAEKIWAAKDAMRQEEYEKTQAIAKEDCKKITKKQKDVFDSLPGTEWVNESKYAYEDVTAVFSDEEVEIKIEYSSEYFPEDSYTLILKGKYAFNTEKAECAEVIVNRDDDIIVKADKLIINGDEKSTEDVTGYINLIYDKEDDGFFGNVNEVNYYMRNVECKISLSSYAGVSREVRNNYNLQLIKK